MKIIKRLLLEESFCGSGSINNPEKEYHLEINLSNKCNLDDVVEMLQGLGIQVKTMTKQNQYSIYIKEGEQISNFLALIGANNAVLKFEDIRIQREMRGKVNRLVNCEAANLNKTINASIEQIAAINKLKEKGEFNKLSDSLKEMANLRVKYPNLSLIDLGKMLKEPVGKSGVNYRLRKIVQIAKEIN